jgi:hypothetical protein
MNNKRYSRPVKVEGKLFMYDHQNSMVLYVGKVDKKISHLFEDEELIDGKYFVVDRAGLNKANWVNKEVRHDYLAEWAFELDCEVSSYDLSEFM